MKLSSVLILLIFVISTFQTKATNLEVGSNKTYKSPNALYLANVVKDGDTISIDAEDYTGTTSLARWAGNNLYFHGVGGKPHLEAAGKALQGKGTWIIAGNDNIVENIEFSGATVVDQNGAGIRFENLNLTVRYCYFHNNDDGILTGNPNAGDILVENSEFGYNGFGDGYSHNIYVGHAASFTLRYCYMHHAKIGHNMKSRAAKNLILYNRIMDEETGNSSRLIDLPNGGLAIVMGNLLMQGPNAENSNMVEFGLEGLINPAPQEFYFINNTCVNKRSSCVFVQVQSGTSVVNISNNIFAGKGTILTGTSTSYLNNYINTDISALKFVDETNYNYDLSSKSPAIDYGKYQAPVYGISLTPELCYVHPHSSRVRTVEYGFIDAGAYEYTFPFINVPVDSIILNIHSTTLFEKDTFQLNYDILPINATNKNVAWIVSDNNIATISQSGLVTALAKGTTKIIIKTNDGGYSDTCIVMVDAKNISIPVNAVILNKKTVTLYEKDSIHLNYEILPINATNTKVAWINTDNNIVSISQSGLVSALAKGTTKIIIKTEDGGYSDTCIVEVLIKSINVPVKSVILNKHSSTLNEKDTFQLNYDILPINATNKKVVWIITDDSVVNISQNGLVTALAEGTAKIIIKTEDGGYSDTCIVTVWLNTGIENDKSNNEFNIYPNPSTSEIFISNVNSINYEIEVLNIIGALIYKTENQEKIDISGFTRGIYLIKINNYNKIITKCFIKE